MKILFLSLLAVAGCTYNLDTPAMNDLRQRQAALESAQTQTTATIGELERKQAENDAKIRIMWTHGK